MEMKFKQKRKGKEAGDSYILTSCYYYTPLHKIFPFVQEYIIEIQT